MRRIPISKSRKCLIFYSFPPRDLHPTNPQSWMDYRISGGRRKVSLWTHWESSIRKHPPISGSLCRKKSIFPRRLRGDYPKLRENVWWMMIFSLQKTLGNLYPYPRSTPKMCCLDFPKPTIPSWESATPPYISAAIGGVLPLETVSCMDLCIFYRSVLLPQCFPAYICG